MARWLLIENENCLKGFCLFGRFLHNTLESFLKMIFIIMELTNEQMEGSTKDSGTKIKWKDRDYSLGWTGGLTKESIVMTRSKA